MAQGLKIPACLSGFLLIAMACSACTPTDPNDPLPPPPLPSDRSYNPAGPNCYPDLNHCASYPTGNETKTNPAQPH